MSQQREINARMRNREVDTVYPQSFPVPEMVSLQNSLFIQTF
jgi:hypothetical protein